MAPLAAQWLTAETVHSCRNCNFLHPKSPIRLLDIRQDGDGIELWLMRTRRDVASKRLSLTPASVFCVFCGSCILWGEKGKCQSSLRTVFFLPGLKINDWDWMSRFAMVSKQAKSMMLMSKHKNSYCWIGPTSMNYFVLSVAFTALA